ncbi:tigger transposable element-derived protein 1 [Trichonephila clavipes]|nr:tigger transposable element-derived protein 1 [Trichonephila clavipes]
MKARYGYTTKSVTEPDEINVIGKVIHLARQINLEVDSDVQELLGSHNQELTINDQEQDIAELEFSYQVQSEDRMMTGNLTEILSSIKRDYKILKNTDSNEERIFSTKQRKKLLACSEQILQEEEKIFELADYLIEFIKLSTSK